MKKLSCYIAIAFLGTCFGAAPAAAFLIDQILKSPSIEMPTFNIPQTVTNTGVAVAETFTAGQQLVSQTQSQVNNVRSAINSTMDFNFTALMDGTAAPGQLEYASCNVGDIRVDTLDPESVATAVDKLFLRYPSGSDAQKQTYQKYRKDFYTDSLMEAYVASRQLQLYMTDSVIPSLEKSKKCVLGEAKDCGIPAPGKEDAGVNEVLYNEAKALESIDNLLDVLQKAVAIKAQFRAVKAIYGTEPAAYDPEDEKYDDDGTAAEEKTEAPDDLAAVATLPAVRLAATATTRHSQPLAFAAMDMASSLTAVEDIAATNSRDEVPSRVLNAALAFSDAPESEVFHPYTSESVAANMTKISDLEPVEEAVTNSSDAHNMILNLKSYQQVAQDYNNAKAQHQKALEALRKSNQCAFNYLGRHYSNPDTAWAGKSLGNNVADFEGRKGISGWATTAFDTAKAAQTSSVTTDDVPLPNIDGEDNKYSDFSNTDAAMATFEQDNTNVSIGASKEEQTAKENRAAMLLPWQLGAEASKVMAQNPGQWGNLNNPFPVWNDTKSFYNQYLDGKYTNVKSYLKAFSVNDVKALLVAELQGDKKDPAETSKMKSVKDLGAKQSNVQNAAREDKVAADQAQQKQVSAAVAALQRQREQLVSQLDTAAAKTKELSDELADRRQNASDNAINDVAKSVTDYDGFGNHSATDLFEELDKAQADKHSALEGHARFAAAFVIAGAYLDDQDAVEEAVKAKTETNKQAANLDGLQQQLSSQQQTVKSLQDQLSQLDQQIKQAKLNAQQQASKSGESLAAKLQGIGKETAEAKEKAEKEFAAAADANILNVATSVAGKLQGAFALANPTGQYNGPTAASLSGGLNLVIERAMGDLYEKIDQRVDQARKQLTALGDALYKPENHAQVVQIHQSMLNDIKAMPLRINYSAMGIATTIYMYAKVIPADTSAETEDYFVGSPSKERDLKAPKAVPVFSLPPLREAFHFDDIDFENVKPFDINRPKSEPIAAADFLNFGGDIPGIWKLLLAPNAFVESDVDLNKALNSGCSAEAFFRGGVMPCRVAGSSTIVDVNASGRYIRGSASGNLQQCPNMVLQGGAVYDPIQEINIQFASAKDIPAADCAYSELGTLLDADKNNTLSFRQSTYDVFYNTLKQQQELQNNTEISDEMRQKLAAYSAAPLSVNQIGDYLKYVESEQQHRKNVEELKASYEAVMNNLNELFAKFGLETSQTFDLSKDSDYSTVRERLDRIKNQRISFAQEQLDKVEVAADDEVLGERVGKYRDIISALNKDRDEQVQITAVVVDNNNLDAELKTAQVDGEVHKRYEKNLDQTYISKQNIPASPYCAIY